MLVETHQIVQNRTIVMLWWNLKDGEGILFRKILLKPVLLWSEGWGPVSAGALGLYLFPSLVLCV